jgi:aspartate racemase
MTNLKDPSNSKVVGILGGMGPYATIMFMKNILDITDAHKDWEHIRAVTDNNTHIPSRSRAVLYNETSPLEAMVESCRKLQNYPVDIIVIPCNSACFWASELQREIKTPVVNIVDIAVETLMSKYKPSRVTALGGTVTYLKDLYKNSVERLGAEYVSPCRAAQEKVVGLIEQVKLGARADDLGAAMAEIVTRLIDKEAIDGVILGCTEFTEFRDHPFAIPVVDSSFALAQFIVDYAKHDRPISLDTGSIKNFWQERANELRKGELGLLQSTMLTATEEEARRKDDIEKATLLKVLVPFLNKQGIILELGCGHGRWSRTLSQYVKQIDAYDYSESLIEAAKRLTLQENIKNISFLCSSAENIVLQKEYDWVVSIALLHYLSDEQYNKVIRLIRQAVKKGGLAVFRESFGANRRFELHGYYSEVLSTEYHSIYRTTDELIQEMGFEFSVVCEDVSLPPADDKPETCQKIVMFRKR